MLEKTLFNFSEQQLQEF